MLDQPMDQEAESPEMSFLDHLEILRWHIIRSLIAVVAMTTVALFSRKILVAIIMGPTDLSFWTYRKLCELSTWAGTSSFCIESLDFTLINREMMGQFTQHLVLSIFAGFILAFPYILFELWRFLKPALSGKERNYVRGVVFFGSLLFFLGILSGYYLLAPVSIQFLANYTFIETLENTIDLRSYMSLVTLICLASALVFELPIVVYFLAKANLITPALMKKYRKHALVVILVISAIITPPDVLSQLLLTIPFFILYEISIFVAAFVQKRRVD